MLCEFFHDLCLRYPGMTQVWTRSDRTRLTDSVLRVFEDEVLGRQHPLHKGQVRLNRHSYSYPNGSLIILQGLDDEERQKSVGADVLWVNEPTEITLDRLEELLASQRETLSTSCPFKLFVGDHNPAPPNHWTNTETLPLPDELYPGVKDDGTRMGEWFTPEMYRKVLEYNTTDQGRRFHRIQTFHPDNWGYWDWDIWGWKRPGLRYVQDVLGRYRGSRRAKYLEGRPAAEEDVVFPEFEKKTHVIPRFPRTIQNPDGWPKGWPVWCLYDPGFRHPCAVNFVGIAPNERPYFVDEIHGAGINIDELGPRIQQKAAKYRMVGWLADPKGADQKLQLSNGKTAMDYMREKFGLHFHPWPGKRGRVVQDQVELLRHWLVMPEPLQIFDDCPGIISNFETWKNKKAPNGELPEGDDRYEDKNNDGIDGLLGLVASRPTHDRPVARLA